MLFQSAPSGSSAFRQVASHIRFLKLSPNPGWMGMGFEIVGSTLNPLRSDGPFVIWRACVNNTAKVAGENSKALPWYV